MNETITAAVIQCSLGNQDPSANITRVAELVREAAEGGAQVVLPPELFAGPYFPQEERADAFDLAHETDKDPSVAVMRALAEELGVVIPVSFFEREGANHYNSVAIIDADGALLGTYRKSHIPAGPGYQEKFYFRPGDHAAGVYQTKYGSIGVGICWDQWFPECARSMALSGAELLLYPTAIGSEPGEVLGEDEDTRDPWRRVMVGHAVANAMPVLAANRVGTEQAITFYGSSFICDQRGDIVAELDTHESGIALATFERDALRRYRASWGFFRDRRPELYTKLTE